MVARAIFPEPCSWGYGNLRNGMLLLFFAALPVLLLLAALFLARVPLFAAAPLAWLAALATLGSVWEMPAAHLLAGTLKGLLVAADILFIIFGAIFFLEFLRQTPVLRAIETHLAHLSADRRIQAVLVAFLFGGFVEGSAGFGTPAAIVAPFLVAIGFPAITAVVVALSANSTAVAFGAVGTPVRVGLAGLDLTGVVTQAAWINLFAGLLVPLIIVALVVGTTPATGEEGTSRRRAFLEAAPWALWAGATFLVPYVLISYVGYEFPSLLGAPIGLFLTGVSLKKGFLVPRHRWDFDRARIEARTGAAPVALPLWKAAVPYAVLTAFLLGGKLLFSGARYTLTLLPDVTHALAIFNPGLAFILSAALLLRLREFRSASLAGAAARASRTLVKPVVAVFFITAMVQVLILSAHNEAGLPGALQVIAASIDPALLPWISPFVGAFGSFMAGSATVSNLLFGSIQADLAAAAGVSLANVLALQLVGAGVGNMVALSNILAVEATVGQTGNEAAILRKLAIPCLIYLALAAGVGWALDWITVARPS